MGSSEATNGKVRKKKRVINSCQFCRSKKLKCEKQKPKCSTCVKLGITCLYYDTPNFKDSYIIDQQIRELSHKIELLVQEKSKCQTPNDFTQLQTNQKIEFQCPLSLFSLFQKDAYLNCLMRNIRGSGFPLKISQEFEREKRQSSNMDLIKFEMFQRKLCLYDLIKTHLLNENLRFLVMHFFETELYINNPFIIKQNFLTLLDSFMPNNIVPQYIRDPLLYLFLGQLLLIMRISSISKFNCGYPEVKQSYTIPSEVVFLAQLCLDEVTKPLHVSTLEYIQLSLLLEYYHLYSPESVSSIDDVISLDINRLIRITSMSGYNNVNCTQKDKTQTNKTNNSKGYIWAKLIDLDYTKFLNDGTPLSLNEEYYSSKLPTPTKTNNEQSETTIIIKTLQKRAEIFGLIKPFSEILNNVKNKPLISTIEMNLDQVLDYIKNNNLDHILQRSSKTLQDRCIKSVMFANLIDLCSLNFMVSLHVTLTQGVTEEVCKRMTQRIMESFNIMLSFSYFLDPTRHPLFNLQKQFGFNIHLIPKLLQAQHRAFQFQLSLLIRSHFHAPSIYGKELETLKSVSTSNIRVLLVNFGRNSKFYVYSKRLHMMHSFMVLKNFGVSLDKIASINFQSLLEASDINFEDKELHELHTICQQSLIKLIGDQEILSNNAITGPQVNELENFLTQNGLDSSTIDQLENFLEKQTFLI